MERNQEFAPDPNQPAAASSPPSAASMNWPTITDDMMLELKTRTRPYTLVILKAGPQRSMPGVEQLIWEHGRRNLSLRAAGLLSFIFPVADGGDVCGVGIFNAESEGVQQIMAQDPAIQAGVFTCEVHPTRSFPGDALPHPSDAQGHPDQTPASGPLLRHLGLLFHYPTPEARETMLQGFLSVAAIMNAQPGVQASTYEEVETGALVAVTRYESLEAVQAGFSAVAASGIDPAPKPDREAQPRELHRLLLIQSRE